MEEHEEFGLEVKTFDQGVKDYTQENNPLQSEP
jgi:hypothetical protein